MSDRLLRVAATLVKRWTQLYTWGAPERERRIAEIESDLWECAHDPDNAQGAAVPWEVLARLVQGMPDDLVWRVEQERIMRRHAVGIGVAVAVTLTAASAAALIFSSPVRPLQPPPAPVASERPMWSYPAPQPPPPPPGGGSARPFAYGHTSYTVLDGPSTLRKIKDVPPVYPPIAVDAGLTGTVRLEATVDARGRVENARVVQPVWLLSQAAIDAVRQWEFEPVSRAKTILSVTVRFE